VRKISKGFGYEEEATRQIQMAMIRFPSATSLEPASAYI